MAVANRDLYLNKDKDKVLEQPEEKGFTLAVKDGFISEEDVERYKVPKKYLDKPEEVVAEEPNIVISGGSASGPSVVTGKPLAEADDSDDKKRRK